MLMLSVFKTLQDQDTNMQRMYIRMIIFILASSQRLTTEVVVHFYNYSILYMYTYSAYAYTKLTHDRSRHIAREQPFWLFVDIPLRKTY